MLEKLSSLPPADAWHTLPAVLWDEAAARHLLQRVGFSATPPELARVLKDGPVTTLNRYFARMPAFARPAQVGRIFSAACRLWK